MSGSISDDDWEITGSLNEVDSSDDCDLSDSSSEDRAVDDWELTESSNDVMVRQDGNEKSATDNNSPKGEVFDGEASTCEVQKTDKVLVAENVAHMKEGLPKLEDKKVQVDEEEQVESLEDSYKEESPKVEDNLSRWNEEELKEIIDMFEQRLEETTSQLSDEAEDQARFLKGYSTQELRKVEEKTETVEQLLKESMLRLEQLLAEERVARLKAEESLVASVIKRNADIDEQAEYLKDYSKQEIIKVEEKTEMVEQRLKETMSRLEQQLAEEHAARLKAEDALEAALMRCTIETEEQLESLQAYSKQEIGKVEEKIMMIAQATLELEQRLEDEQSAYNYKGIDSVEKDILGLDVDIGLLERRLDKIEKDKEEEVKTYRSNEEKLKEIIEKVEQRFRETTLRLEQQLAEEKAARMKSEVLLQEAQTDSSNEICKLKESLAKAEKETEELRKVAKTAQGVANELSAPSPTSMRSSVTRQGFHEVQVKRINRNFSGSYCSYTSSDIVVPVRPYNVENHCWI